MQDLYCLSISARKQESNVIRVLHGLPADGCMYSTFINCTPISYSRQRFKILHQPGTKFFETLLLHKGACFSRIIAIFPSLHCFAYKNCFSNCSFISKENEGLQEYADHQTAGRFSLLQKFSYALKAKKSGRKQSFSYDLELCDWKATSQLNLHFYLPQTANRTLTPQHGTTPVLRMSSGAHAPAHSLPIKMVTKNSCGKSYCLQQETQ